MKPKTNIMNDNRYRMPLLTVAGFSLNSFWNFTYVCVVTSARSTFLIAKLRYFRKNNFKMSE